VLLAPCESLRSFFLSLVPQAATKNAGEPHHQDTTGEVVLPRAEEPFKGKIVRTAKDSTPDFPKGVEAPAGAPNVIIILTDDVGFGASSTFGGPIETPNFQRVADAGLRYNTFHTTALCSPTRAALITGRNHHSVASGMITEMEVYAGALSHADHHIGRVLDAVEESGQLDNTLVIFIMGDNGASAEGSMQGTTNEIATAANGIPESLPYLLSMLDKLGSDQGYNHYPVGWALAMDAPMQWTKQVASHFGGTRNGMVISWPERIKDKGGLRSLFCHVIDIVPTIYEAAGIAAPTIMNGAKQKPLEGTSLVYSFDKADAPERHTTQYFELAGNRAIYKDGWIASTTPLRLPWISAGVEPNPDDFKWELYHVAEDFSQAHDLAQK